MATVLPDWGRKYYEKPGGRPRLFYVAFGKPDGPLAISASQYRCAGIPDGLEINGYGPGKHPEEVGRFRAGYLWNELEREDAALAAKISAADGCFRLDADLDDSPTLNYLRDTIGFLTYLLDHGFSGIYDPFMLRYWSKETWRRDVFDPAGPVPRQHVVTLVGQDGPDTEWFHTRGMRKFGRPDLSVRSTPPKHRDAVIQLIDRFIEIRDLPSGMLCHHRGELDDPDFNNVHVEIEWPKGENQ
jgi:hypothetical protein